MLVQFNKKYLGIKKNEAREVTELAGKYLLQQNIAKQVTKSPNDKMIKREKTK